MGRGGDGCVAYGGIEGMGNSVASLHLLCQCSPLISDHKMTVYTRSPFNIKLVWGCLHIVDCESNPHADFDCNSTIQV